MLSFDFFMGAVAMAIVFFLAMLFKGTVIAGWFVSENEKLKAYLHKEEAEIISMLRNKGSLARGMAIDQLKKIMEKL